MLAAAGVEAEPDWNLDGVNILPQLENRSTAEPHDALYWLTVGQMAVRQGDWKLVSYMQKIDEGDVHRSETSPLTPQRLYNLRDDIGETNDLAAAEPERVKEMQSLWDKWNASMPKAPQGGPANPAPSADRAPIILRSLDADGDGKISESEAVGGIKQNFSMIDSNGDGGIDLAELTAILKTVAAQGGRR